MTEVNQYSAVQYSAVLTIAMQVQQLWLEVGAASEHHGGEGGRRQEAGPWGGCGWHHFENKLIYTSISTALCREVKGVEMGPLRLEHLLQCSAVQCSAVQCSAVQYLAPAGCIELTPV